MPIRSSRRKVYGALLAALGLAAAGCGSSSLDIGKLKRTLHAKLSNPPFSLNVASVSCPSSPSTKVGSSFGCTITLTNGDAIPYKITVTNSKPSVHYGPVDMIAAFVQNTLQSGLKARGINATATCPQTVPIVVGNKFNCALVTPAGKRATGTVQIVGTGGQFQLVALH